MSDQDTLATQFHEGLCLAAGGQHDRAGDVFLECVLAEPGRGEFVQEFLTNLARRFPLDNLPASTAAGAAEEPIRRAAEAGNWTEVARQALRLVARYPWHVSAMVALAEACEAQGQGD